MQYRQPPPISLWAVCFPSLNNLLLKLCVSAELFPSRRQEWRTYHTMTSRYVVWERDCWNGKFLSDIQNRWWQFNRNCPKGDWMDVISDLAPGGWRSVFYMPPPTPNCLSHSTPGFRWYWGGHGRDVWRISSFVLVVVGGKFCTLCLYSFMKYCRTHQTAEVLWFREEHSESGDHSFIAQTYIGMPTIQHSTKSWLCKWEH